MDFRQTFPTAGNRPAPAPAPAAPERREEKGPSRTDKKSDKAGPEWLKILTILLLVGIVGLLVTITFSFTSSKKDTESSFVDMGKYQAVFLNNGQVYFGNIKDLNSNYLRMTNIYYLTQGNTSSSSSSSSNYSLVKLGCQQIHDPLDEMVINRSQVTFWENLNPSGKVVSSIKQFIQQNPNGPDCSQVSNQTQATGSTGTQGATTPSSSSSTGSSNK
jgi:hypothetical protein